MCWDLHPAHQGCGRLARGTVRLGLKLERCQQSQTYGAPCPATTGFDGVYWVDRSHCDGCIIAGAIAAQHSSMNRGQVPMDARRYCQNMGVSMERLCDRNENCGLEQYL